MTIGRGIVVPLRVDRKGFIASMNAASMSMGRFQTQMASYSRGIQNMMTFSVAIIGISALKNLNRAYRDVEDRLLSVEAKTRASAESMKKLKNEIIEVSRISPKTTAEIALFAETQAKMGFTTQQIRDQVRGTVMASTATGSSMEHIGFAGGALQRGLGLDSAHFQRISDLLVAAVNNSAATIEELMVTFRYAVAAIPGLGLTLEEAMTLVMGLYNVNVKGSVAGTAFRSGFAALIRGTQEVTNLSSDFEKSVRMGTKILAKYGLSIKKDPETGNISNFMQILKTLREANDGKGAPLEDFMYLFGTRAGPYWASMTNLTEEAWQHILDAVASAQGMGKKTFDKMMQSTTKQWELVGAKWDVLQQRMSDAGLILVEKKVIKFLQDLLDTLDKYVPTLAAVATALAPFIIAISGLLIFNVIGRVIWFAVAPLGRFGLLLWKGTKALTKMKALRFAVTLRKWALLLLRISGIITVVWFFFSAIWVMIREWNEGITPRKGPFAELVPGNKELTRMQRFGNIVKGIGEGIRVILDVGFRAAKALSFVALETSLFLKPYSKGVLHAINAPLSEKVRLIKDRDKARKEWEASWAQREKDWDKALDIGGKYAYKDIRTIAYTPRNLHVLKQNVFSKLLGVGGKVAGGTAKGIGWVMRQPIEDMFGTGPGKKSQGVPEWLKAWAEGTGMNQVELEKIFPGLYAGDMDPTNVSDAEYAKELAEIDAAVKKSKEAGKAAKGGGKKGKTPEELAQEEAERKAAEEQAAKENWRMRWENLAQSVDPYVNRMGEALELLKEKYMDIKMATKDEMRTINNLIWEDLGRVMQMAVQHSKKMSKALALIRLREAYIAIKTGVANAMALPFPQNLAAAGLVAVEGWAIYKDIKEAIKGQAHDGMTRIPSTGSYLLEAGERVVKKDQNDDLTSFLANQRQSAPMQFVLPDDAEAVILKRSTVEMINRKLMEIQEQSPYARSTPA